MKLRDIKLPTLRIQLRGFMIIRRSSTRSFLTLKFSQFMQQIHKLIFNRNPQMTYLLISLQAVELKNNTDRPTEANSSNGSFVVSVK